MAFSTSSNATGSEEMKRTERRAAIRSANSREARNCSGGGMRIKSSATCLYGFIASVYGKLSTFLSSPIHATFAARSTESRRRGFFQSVTFPRDDTKEIVGDEELYDKNKSGRFSGSLKNQAGRTYQN